MERTDSINTSPPHVLTGPTVRCEASSLTEAVLVSLTHAKFGLKAMLEDPTLRMHDVRLTKMCYPG